MRTPEQIQKEIDDINREFQHLREGTRKAISRVFDDILGTKVVDVNLESGQKVVTIPNSN